MTRVPAIRRDEEKTRRRIARGGGLALLAGLALVLTASATHASRLVAEAPLDVRIVESGPETVTYQVTNRGVHPVRDVEVLVSHVFHWEDEFAPGTNNPSRATTQPVPAALEPGESTRVTYVIGEPLPQRDDGHFEVEIDVLRWTAELPRR